MNSAEWFYDPGSTPGLRPRESLMRKQALLKSVAEVRLHPGSAPGPHPKRKRDGRAVVMTGHRAPLRERRKDDGDA